MRYSQDHVDETAARIRAQSARVFREFGFAGIGIDGLAKAAGVTSGGFYKHFRSKAEAFKATSIEGLDILRQGIAGFMQRAGSDWLAEFTKIYLGAAHRRDIAGGCALPSLTVDVQRADRETRLAYQEKLKEISQLIDSSQPEAAPGTLSWPLLAQLLGGVILARTVVDETLASEIAEAVKADILARKA